MGSFALFGVCLGERKLILLDEKQRLADQGPSKYSRNGKDEMPLLKKTIKSTKMILEKFARYEEKKTEKRKKLVQKGIDFVMETLERTNAIVRNDTNNRLVKYDEKKVRKVMTALRNRAQMFQKEGR